MKKVIDSLSEQLQPVKLYFGDIENLFQILSEISSDIKIEACGYEFQKVNELNELDEESIQSFKIYCRNPYVSLEINKRSTVWLFTDKDLPAQRGLIEKMKKELVQKKRYNLPTIVYLIFFILSFNVLLYFASSYITNLLENLLKLSLATLIISFLIGYVTYHLYQSKGSIIFLNKKINSPNFWKRNKDQIIVAVIGAIVGAVATFLLIQP